MTTEQKHRPFNACCIDWRLDAENTEEERDTLAAKVKELEASALLLQLDASKKIDEFESKLSTVTAQRDELAAVFSAIMKTDTARDVHFKLMDGQGTKTIDGQMWLEAEKLIAKIEAEKATKG